jgi:hypothetical protein
MAEVVEMICQTAPLEALAVLQLQGAITLTLMSVVDVTATTVPERDTL